MAGTPAMTAGQALLADIFPPDVYRPGQEIDKKTVSKLFGDLARKHPEKYADVTSNAVRFGEKVARMTGGGTFTLDHLATPKGALQRRKRLHDKIKNILETAPPEKQDELIVQAIREVRAVDVDKTLEEATAENNPLTELLRGAGRGNPAALARLISSDLMYADASGKPLPIPVLNSYSRGLTPTELVAGAFGARSGIVDAKLSVSSSGYLSKLIKSAAHRMVVTGNDGDDAEYDPGNPRGLVVDTEDGDNVGSLLAMDVGPYKRNTVLTPKILRHLAKLKHNEIMVRSPITTSDTSGGVFARDVGIRETGDLPQLGDMVGVTASDAVSEPITQSALSSKHKGGAAEGQSERISGFDLIEKLFNPPKNFRDAATHAELDGKIRKIEKASQGGHYVYIGDESHYVPKEANVTVKVGQLVEAGDQLSDGFINPRKVVQHKGLGEGARQLTYALRRAIRESGSNASRRNLELITAGLVNRVRMTKEFGDYVPTDIVPYNKIAAQYKPREGFQTLHPEEARNQYLERPVMHYTIGTRITPSISKRMKQFGVKQITTHSEPPPFEPEMVRAADLLQSDEDWFTRNLGTGLQKGMLEATHRGRSSDEQSTSFVASRARATNFGEVGPFKREEKEKKPLPSLGYQ